ncbi:MAG: HIRAN domain-containing protein [Bacteroidales bacterium]|nr:HIRAN domain-containing protein [Bacteroidales bacterium]
MKLYLKKINQEIQSDLKLSPLFRTYFNTIFTLFEQSDDFDDSILIKRMIDYLGIPIDIPEFSKDYFLPDIEKFDDFIKVNIYNKRNKHKATKVLDYNGNLVFEVHKLKISPLPFMNNRGLLFTNGVALLQKKIKNVGKFYGIISSTGKIIIEPVYHYIYDDFIKIYNKFYTFCKKEDKTGFIDIQNPSDIVFYNIDTKDLIHWSSDYFFKVRINDKYGYIKANQEFALNPIYDDIQIVNNLIIVKIGDKYGLLSKYGPNNTIFNKIVEVEYTEINIINDIYSSHNEIVFAILKKSNDKFAVYDDKRAKFVDLDCDYCFGELRSDFVCFIKDGKKAVYSFNNANIYWLDNDINIDTIDKIGGSKYYYSVSSVITGKFAITDKRFNLITEFIFNHPIEYYQLSNEFVVYLFKEKKNYAINRITYSKNVFFHLFAKNSKFNYSNFPEQILPVIDSSDKDYGFILIAGTQYQDTMKINMNIKDGDALCIVPEPDNDFDKNAVALYKKTENENIKIGYIPRKFNSKVIMDIKAGKKLSALVYSIIKNDFKPEIVIEIIVCI